MYVNMYTTCRSSLKQKKCNNTLLAKLYTKVIEFGTKKPPGVREGFRVLKGPLGYEDTKHSQLLSLKGKVCHKGHND